MFNCNPLDYITITIKHYYSEKVNIEDISERSGIPTISTQMFNVFYCGGGLIATQPPILVN